MNTNKDFFERLYRGYEAESLVGAQLFGRGLEAFRLPADFGFDLVVSNAFASAFSSTTGGGNFPWLLQVKSRRVSTELLERLPEQKDYGCYEFRTTFTFSRAEWEQIKQTNNGYLVLVVILTGEMPWGQVPKPTRVPSKLSTRHDAFLWFSARQLQELESIVQMERETVSICVCYRSRPTGRISDHFEKIAQFAPPTCKSEIDKLRARLPKYSEVPLERGDVFGIVDRRDVMRQVAERQLSLNHLGCDLGKIDAISPFAPQRRQRA